MKAGDVIVEFFGYLILGLILAPFAMALFVAGIACLYVIGCALYVPVSILVQTTRNTTKKNR